MLLAQFPAHHIHHIHRHIRRIRRTRRSRFPPLPPLLLHVFRSIGLADSGKFAFMDMFQLTALVQNHGRVDSKGARIHSIASQLCT